jgi:hypothetical protein
VRRALALLLVLGVVLGGGCGGSDDQGEPSGERVISDTIPAVDVARVKDAQDAIAAACGAGADAKKGTTESLGKAVTDLADVYSQYPEGRYTSGSEERVRDMERVVTDNVRHLRDCGRAKAADRLARSLKKNP